MAEYIERAKVLAKAAPVEGCFSDMVSAYDVASIPAADVVEVRHGRWVKAKDPIEDLWFCSECKTLGSPQWKGCPVCLARMDGE